MNRGSIALRQSADAGEAASMRPRFMNRGSLRIVSLDESEPIRFNEAPIHESGKFGQYKQACGIRCSFNEAPIHESGKSAEGAGIREATQASMRPRFMNRGSLREVRGDDVTMPASMRPRFMNRGSARNVQASLRQSVELQ